MPDSATESLNPNEASSVLRNVLQETKHWSTKHLSNSLVTPAAAVSALGELSPGGALMRGFQEQSLAREYPLYSVYPYRKILPLWALNS